MAYKSQSGPKTLILTTTRISKESELLLTSDRKGDDQNLLYGSLDKYKTPRYRAAGYGRLIGLDRRFRISSASDTNRELDDGGDDSTRKDRSTLSLSTTPIVTEDNAKLLTTTKDHRFTHQDDFLAFKSDRRKKRRNLSTPVEEDEYTSRLSPEPESTQQSESSSSEPEHSHDSYHKPEPNDSYEQFRNHPDNQKQIELTNRTNISPADVDAWLKLIQHQEAFFLLSTSNDRKGAKLSEKRAIAEIKLSLYERALQNIVNQAAREELLGGYLTEGAKIWDTKTQLDKWRSVIRDNRSWKIQYRYLNFQQSNPVVFSYDTCLSTYEGLFQNLKHLEPADHDLKSPYLVLRLTTFMYQAGFSERALALWQALLELNFAQSQSNSSGDILDAFEEFWDFEMARLGETKAKGWQSVPGVEIQARIDRIVPKLDKHKIFGNWSVDELRRCKEDIMPARTLDETVEDDPFRIIIFSDIKRFLLEMKTTQGRLALLQAFLKFCGLPAAKFDTWYRQWWSEPFLSYYKSLIDQTESATSLRRFTYGISHVALDKSTLFPDSDWYSAWVGKTSQGSTFEKFALTALTQLVELRSDDDNLAEYVVALKFHYDADSARKFAKKLLKSRSESLTLYNAYALIETRSGRFENAKKVWLTAFSMGSSLDIKMQAQSIQLWSAMVWEILKLKDLQKALKIVIETIPKEIYKPGETIDQDTLFQPTATQKLQAESFYRRKIDASAAAMESYALNAYTEILAILRYLSNDNNLDEACSVFSSTISTLECSPLKATTELLLQSQARLLHLHATTSPSGYRPAQIVKYLKESISKFPENTIFQNLHQQYSQRAGIIDRLRSLPDSSTTTESPSNTNTNPNTSTNTNSILPHLITLTNHISRPLYTGTTTHTIRSSFTKALTPDSPNSAYNNPQLWLDYLNWELSLITSTPTTTTTTTTTVSSSLSSSSSSQAKHLKEIYLTSLRACPWCKELYMQGFSSEVMRNILGEKMLREVYRGMVDRGIRVRIGIEDILDGDEG